MNPSISSTRRRTWSRGNRLSCASRYPTFSSTVSESKSAFSWNSMPISARTASRSRSGRLSTRCSLTKMRPASGRSNPRISLRMTDLPAPLAPRRIRMLPSGTVKLTSRNTSCSSNASDTWSNTTASVGAFDVSRLAEVRSDSRGTTQCYRAGRTTNHEPRTTNHELRTTNYELRTTKIAFVIEQPLLAPAAAGVARELAVGADDAMARDDNGELVPAVGRSDGAHRCGGTDGLRDVTVRSRFAKGDRGEHPPDAMIERGPALQERKVERVARAGEILGELRRGRGEHRIAPRDDRRSKPLSHCRQLAFERPAVDEFEQRERLIRRHGEHGTEGRFDPLRKQRVVAARPARRRASVNRDAGPGGRCPAGRRAGRRGTSSRTGV